MCEPARTDQEVREGQGHCDGALSAVECADIVVRHGDIRIHALMWQASGAQDTDMRPDRMRDPIVLLHGFSQSAHAWDTVAPRLACVFPGTQVWAPEFVGHGESTHALNASPYQFDALVECLDAFVQHALSVSGLDGANAPACSQFPRMRAALVGYSMGGRVAAQYACEHPERLSSLVLESAGLGPARAEMRKRAAQRNAGLAERLRTESLASFMDFWERQPVFASQAALPEDMRKELRQSRMANDPQCLALTLEGSGQHAMPYVLPSLAQVDLPMLYVAGALDEKYAALARSFREACPHAQVQVLVGAGHDVHFEDPQAFAHALEAFFASQTERTRS